MNQPDAGARVGAMLDAQRHRGPDGRGALEFAGGAAGMVRLALVDLSPRGQQPLWSPCQRVAILFNGEMYNFRSHRDRLAAAGYPFRSATDAEVALALFLEQGAGFVDQLRGMFALALFDWRSGGREQTPEVWLARDPLGIKPLYLATTPREGLVFASELRAVLASGLVARELAPDALAEYLAWGYPQQPRTLVAGVEQLPPGTIAHYAPGQPSRQTTYWTLPPDEPRTETLDGAAGRLRQVLDESVRLHALADAPVGAFLSGGVDSATMVALMRRHVSPLRTYTLAFPDLPGHDEARAAAETAQRLECQHTTVDVTGHDIVAQLPAYLASVDQPSIDGLNTWLVSAAAARDVKGVLSGVGGDEWFAGYPVARRMQRLATHPLRGVVEATARMVDMASQWAPHGALKDRLQAWAGWQSPWHLWRRVHQVFDDRQIAGLLAPGFSSSPVVPLASTFRSALDLACQLDVGQFLGRRLLRDSDQASMAHSLELRLPLVDVELASFARSCADQHKLDTGRLADRSYCHAGAKLVLLRAVADDLPPELLARPKRGFTLPIVHWLRGPLADWLQAMCQADVVRRRGWLAPAAVAGLTGRRAGTPSAVNYPQLWSLAMLESWAQHVLDAPRSVPADRPSVPQLAKR